MDCLRCPVAFEIRWHGERSYEAKVALSWEPKCCRHSLQRAIAELTDRVVAKRVLIEKGLDVTENANVPAVPRPSRVLAPLAVEATSPMFGALRERMSQIRDAYADLAQVTYGLHQDVTEAAEQLHKHREELRFELGATGDNEKKAG